MTPATLDTLTSALEHASDLAEMVNLYQQRAALLLASGRPTEARDDLETALALDEQHPDALAALGALYIELGCHAEAVEAYTRLVAVRPLDPTAQWRLGEARLSAKDALGAFASWERAVALAPDFVEAYLSWGAALEGRSQPAEAERVYGLGLSHAPDRRLRVARGSLRMAGNQDEGALEDLSAAIETGPEPKLLVKRATVYRRRGAVEPAREDLLRARSMAPASALADIDARLAALPAPPPEGLAPTLPGAGTGLEPGAVSLFGQPIVVSSRPIALAEPDEAITYHVTSGQHGDTLVRVSGDGRVHVANRRAGMDTPRTYDGMLDASAREAFLAVLATNNPRQVMAKRMPIAGEAHLTIRVDGPDPFTTGAWDGEARDNPIQNRLRQAFIGLARDISGGDVTA